MPIETFPDLVRPPSAWSPGDALSRGAGICVVLDAEWAGLCRLPSVRRRWRAWRCAHPTLATVASPTAAVDEIRHGDLGRSVLLTHALLDLVADGEDLAVRVLLQVIVPALVGELSGWLVDIHRPGPRAVLPSGEVDQLVAAEATQAIHDVARSRRSRWPVADIVRRLHRLLVRRVRAQRAWTAHHQLARPVADDTVRDDQPVAVAAVDADPGDGPDGDTALELGRILLESVVAGELSPEDGRLVWLTRIAGYRPAELVERCGASADTLRRRRHRAESRLGGSRAA